MWLNKYFWAHQEKQNTMQVYSQSFMKALACFVINCGRLYIIRSKPTPSLDLHYLCAIRCWYWNCRCTEASHETMLYWYDWKSMILLFHCHSLFCKCPPMRHKCITPLGIFHIQAHTVVTIFRAHDVKKIWLSGTFCEKPLLTGLETLRKSSIMYDRRGNGMHQLTLFMREQACEELLLWMCM